MLFSGDPHRRSVALLTGGFLLILVLMGAFQAFNTTLPVRIGHYSFSVDFLNPETAGETLISTVLMVLVFLLLLLLLVLLLRNILKLYAGQGSSGLGARLRSRMILGAVLIALIPAMFMFFSSYLLMNRSMDRWFSPNTSELHDDSTRVVVELAQYVTGNARGEAESIAATGALDSDLQVLQAVLAAHRITLDNGFAIVYDQDKRVMTSFQTPPSSSPASLIPWLEEGGQGDAIPLKGPLSMSLLTASLSNPEPVIKVAGREYALGRSASSSGKVVVTALPMPQGLSQTTARIRTDSATYWELYRERKQLRTILFLMLVVLTVLVIFMAVWMARFLSGQITRPVEGLAVAMAEIATGKYDHRVELIATGEMGELVRAFNHMAADLETSRQLAESSSAQLTAANLAIEERRRELETIVETIPSGVVTLDGRGTVLQSNRAFAALLGRSVDSGLGGEKIETLFSADCAEDLTGVIRRGRRMGLAFTEIEFHSGGRILHLAITAARFEQTRGRPGTVLVVEDTTELLRAQRQLAWKEVAQRVAHEIKNPLTPIALSAERIGRHLDRGQPDSPAVIRKCSEVILSCVSTLRKLVDQFSALAEFPAPQPRACDMNQVTDEALALFAGRLDGITVERSLEPGLPPVLADPEAIRRALANLIDNAAEAMQGSLLRVLSVQTALTEDGAAVEVAVSDTGHGLTDEIRERLFLPFYSTKQRGTGLGLSIAAKIVQEHGGSLRAEANTPKGARFLLRLPLMEPLPGEPTEQPIEAASNDTIAPASSVRESL
ncbi:MAG: ATP-binding protein [Terracidiphilus sp.]|jgi:PAS domain S-box-containing protein